MKVLHVSTNDIKGGAALTASSLVTALNKNTDITAELLVRDKFSKIDSIRQVGNVDRGMAKFFSFVSQFYFKLSGIQYHSFPFGCTKLSYIVENGHYDLVHLHWVQAFFVDIADLQKIKSPIVWTLHDKWPLTLLSHLELSPDVPFFRDRIKQLTSVLKKMNAYKRLVLVSPSKHLADTALEMGWQHVRVVRNQFTKHKHSQINFDSNVSLPKVVQDIGMIVAAGAKDTNKGLDDFIELAKYNPTKNFHVLGIDDLKLGPNIKTYTFTASRAFVFDFLKKLDYLFIPSKYENFPSVAIEAFQVGTPVIGYRNNPGVSEIISESRFGKLIDAKDNLRCASIFAIEPSSDISLTILDDCYTSYLQHMKLYNEILSD